MSDIGTLNEKHLHASLKQWYSRPGDLLEERVEGFIVDIVRKDLLVEIQTGAFSSIRSKLNSLCRNHRVRLVYPLAYEKWIIKLGSHGKREISRRKSPKRGRIEDIFSEMIRLPGLITNRNFSLEVIFTQQEEVRCFHGKRGWRRKGWLIEERRLLNVLESVTFEAPMSWISLLPTCLGDDFTTGKLADALSIRLGQAQKMAYCFRKAGILRVTGKQGNSYLYRVNPPDALRG